MAFATTTTKTSDLQDALDLAEPDQLPDVLRKVKLGSTLDPLKVTFAALTAAATIDITTAASFAAATVNIGGPFASKTLPPILHVRTLRVTTSGTGASVGSYGVSDAGGAATSPATSTVLGIALLSDDGKSLTFLTTITGFVIEYVPRMVDMTTVFIPSS